MNLSSYFLRKFRDKLIADFVVDRVMNAIVSCVENKGEVKIK